MCFYSCGLFVTFQVVTGTKIVRRSVLSIDIMSCSYILCFVVATVIAHFALCAEEDNLDEIR